MSNFWDTVFQPPTTGETLPPPLNDPFGHLLGTSAGLDTSVNDAGAEAVFPALSPDPNSPNSLIARAGKPNGFDTPAAALSPDVFATWHSAYQGEYINAHKGEQDANGVLTIGAPPAAIHVTLSADQRKVYAEGRFCEDGSGRSTAHCADPDFCRLPAAPIRIVKQPRRR
jgi:hypothetical protein